MTRYVQATYGGEFLMTAAARERARRAAFIAEQRRERRRSARKQLNLSVQQIAKMVKKSPGYIRQIERQGNAPYYLAWILSDIYKVPMEWFA